MSLFIPKSIFSYVAIHCFCFFQNHERLKVMINLKVAIETFSILQFSGFKTFVTRSVFGELQLTQISLNFKTSRCNLKIRGLGAKIYVVFHHFNFERSYNVLKSKSPCILLNKDINFNKNGTKSKVENPTHRFREMNLVLQLI